ncbi:MAG: SAM-dependent methyltransferase [Fibrobacteres bacterium]|jgi:methyltransferase (TIGR00027 family)|nr:SAM-dependent methyltransferase [Fibrobacterota bacterium]
MDAKQSDAITPAEPAVTHVSDTALWVAAVRARESARPDAAFRDPLAAKLAGTRGRELAASMPLGSAIDYALTVRTTAIDRLLAEAIRCGAQRVVNLGAGLDARPYRLQLPSSFDWVEVDFPELISGKESLLAEETAACPVRRIGLDLSDKGARRSLFADLSRDGVPTVLLTEGVIAYLDPESAADLARDMRAAAGFRFWILDYRQGKFRNHRERKAIAQRLQNAPFKFNVEDPKAFFGPLGWRPAEDFHILDIGESIGRTLPIGFPWSWFKAVAPALFRRLANRTYGYVLFEAA